MLRCTSISTSPSRVLAIFEWLRMMSRSTLSFEEGSRHSEATFARSLTISTLLIISVLPFSTAFPVPHRQSLEQSSRTSRSISTSTTQKNHTSAKCLNRFNTHPGDFKECKTNVCFIFLREEPFVMLDKRMTSDAHAVLFPCRTPRSKFPQLHGAAFSVMQMTDARNALCVWGGPRCLFNDMVDFIDRHSPEYQFSASGLLTETSWRRGEVEPSWPSVSIVTEQLVIVGPSKGMKKRKNPFPIYNVLRPFRFNAWALFISFLVVIALFAFWTAFVFGPRERTPRNFYYFFFCDYPKHAVAATTPALTAAESMDSTVEEMEAMFLKRVAYRMSSYKVARRILQLAVSLVVVIFLLFYEMAVVHFLFIESKKPIVQNPKALSKEELKGYSIEENAATEKVWNRTGMLSVIVSTSVFFFNFY